MSISTKPKRTKRVANGAATHERTLELAALRQLTLSERKRRDGFVSITRWVRADALEEVKAVLVPFMIAKNNVPKNTDRIRALLKR